MNKLAPVYQFPSGAAVPQQVQPQTYMPMPQQSWLPGFPTIATMIDQYATKLPWYLWAVAGFYAAYRLIKGK